MSYTINAPIDFANTNATGDVLNFYAITDDSGPLTNNNAVRNFVVGATGDMLFRGHTGENDLSRLAIGPTGYIITSNGTVPEWSQSKTSQGVFTAYITGSVAGIPTSRTGGGGGTTGPWRTLDNTYVTWSTAPPGNDADSVFTTSSGKFTVGVTGFYELNAQITFDFGSGVNSGAGITGPTASLPYGNAVRQVRLYNLTNTTVLSAISVQNSGSNDNNTTCNLNAVTVELNAGDEIILDVRHDRTVSNTITVGDVGKALSAQSYFSGKRIK